MNKRRNIILVTMSVLLSLSGFGQTVKLDKKVHNSIDKGEELYNYGDYFAALTRIKRARKKLIKKGFSQTQNYVLLSIYESKYLEGIGKMYEVQDSLENSIFYFNANINKDSSKYLEALIVLSDAHAQYGNYIKAFDYISKAKKYFNAHKDELDVQGRRVIPDTNTEIPKRKPKVDYASLGIAKDSFLLNKIDKKLLLIQLERGFYRESLKNIDDLISFQRKIAVKKLANPDTSAKKKNLKLPKKEYRKRYEELGSLLVLKADFYRYRGDYKRAATLYKDNEIQFAKKLKSNTLPFIKNEFGLAVMAENDGRSIKASEDFHQLRNDIQKSGKVSNYHKFYNTVTEKEIDSWIREGRFDKAQSLFLSYKLENRSKYGSGSVYFIRALMLENSLANRNKRYKIAAKKEERLREGINTIIPHDHISNLDFNDHFYEFYHKNNQVEEALIERESNLDIAKTIYGLKSPHYSLEAIKLADFNIENEERFAESKVLYEDHFDKVLREELHPHHPEYIDFLTMYAKLKTYVDQYNEAYKMLLEASEIAKAKFGTTSKEFGLTLGELARVNILKGNFEDAEKQLEQARDILKTSGNKKSIHYYNTLKTLADLYMINGKYDESKTTLKAAHKYLKKSGDQSDEEIGNSEELAELYIKTGRYKAAEGILRTAIDLKEIKYGLDHYSLVAPLQLSGELNLVLGEYIEAEKFATRAMDISRQNLGDTAVSYMDNLALLAKIYTAMGNYREAKIIYDKNLVLVRKKFGLNNIREVDILRALAEVNFKSKEASLDTINALLDFSKDIVVTNFSADHPKYAAIIEYQGKVLMLYGKYEESDKLLKEAQAIWLLKFGKNHPNTANNQVLVGDLKYMKEEYVEARIAYGKAATSYENIFDGNHPDYLKARSSEAKCFYVLGQLSAASKAYDETTEKYLLFLRDYFPALSEKEKGNYWNSIKGDFEIYNSLAVDISTAKNNKALGKVYDFKLSTKAILLSSSAKLKSRIANSNDGDLLFRFQLFNQKKALLTKSLAMSPTERKGAGINMVALEKEINRMEKSLSEESEDFAEAFENEQFTWKDVKNTLNENEYAVEIIRYRHFNKVFTDSVIYMALIINKKSKKGPEVIVMGNGNKLDKKYFKGYRNFVKLNVNDKYSYKQFWEKIDSKIPDGASIFLSADGLYNQLNIETLKDNDGKWIIDKNEIYNLSNTKDLVIKRSEKKSELYEARTAVLIGNPKFSGNAKSIDMSNKVSSIEPLPGAEKEIKKVTNLLARTNYKTQQFVGADATEKSVKDVKSPRILHIATHGFFMEEDANAIKRQELTGDIVDNPLLRSGLLFTDAGELLANNNVYDFNKKDGILTAYEAMNLNLDQTELVVLSACETGLGEIKSGEGVYGLQRSFLVAGANNVIMTLFKVNDKVTQELMSDFYSNWLESRNKRQSFQDAKKRIKEKYKQPKLWGSFVLIGLD